MIRTFCDVCGKELGELHENQVNLAFYTYGVSDFEVNLQNGNYTNKELNLCVSCAESVVQELRDMIHIIQMQKETK